MTNITTNIDTINVSITFINIAITIVLRPRPRPVRCLDLTQLKRVTRTQARLGVQGLRFLGLEFGVVGLMVGMILRRMS